MKYLAIILVAVLAILIVVFISWFLNMKANGKCPLCALKKIFIPTKLTIDISEDEEYSENKVAQTPPMGWSSWNTFRNNIDQDIIMQTAHAMKDSGLANAGYEFINLDDCWQSSLRDSDGKLQGDLGTFSRGIPKLIKDINALGLKVVFILLTVLSPVRTSLPLSATKGLTLKQLRLGAVNFLNTIFAIITESVVTALQLSIL